MLQYANFQFCPRCGKKKVEGFKENCLRCKECGFVYFHNCAAAVAGIIEFGQQILLTKRSAEPQKGFLDLPGGFVFYRESLEEALSREVKEELNLEIPCWRYLGSFPNIYSYGGVTYFTADAIFVASRSDLVGLKTGKEIAEAVLTLPQKIDWDQIAFDSIKQGLGKYVEGLR
jgi:NADH pyrophosphatase NudC (nudix superfamily)